MQAAEIRRRKKTRQLTFEEVDAVPEPKLGQTNPEYDKAIPALEKAATNAILVGSVEKTGDQLYGPIHSRVEKYMDNPNRAFDIKQATIDGQAYLQKFTKGTLSAQDAAVQQEEPQEVPGSKEGSP